jgi:hypothetical protein
MADAEQGNNHHQREGGKRRNRGDRGGHDEFSFQEQVDLAVGLDGLGSGNGGRLGGLRRAGGHQGGGHEQREGGQGGSGKNLSRHQKISFCVCRCPLYAPFHVAVQIKLLS